MPEVGEVTRWDSQSDSWMQQYRYVEDLGENRWVIETLPPDDEVLERIFDHYVLAEREGFGTMPIWDKTWSECDKDAGEHPAIIGHTTHAQELEREIRRAEERAGVRMEIQIVSSEQWHQHF